MKIVCNHRLESINYLSSERVVVADLDIPLLPQDHNIFDRLADILCSIPRPKNDSNWADELASNLGQCSNLSQAIALCAEYLQRVIVRFDGRTVCCDDHILPTNSIAIECLEFQVGEACLQASVQIVNSIFGDQSDTLESILAFVDDAHEEHSLGSVTGPLVAAAKRLKVPTRRLDDGSFIQLGHGVYQRRLRRSCTDATGYVGELVSNDKVLVKSLWREVGIPVAEGRAVFTVEDALEAMATIAAPVVIKPIDADNGDGVSVNICSESRMVEAFKKASAVGNGVMLEKFISGSSYRLLVLRGEVVSAVRRDPASVIGDGQSTVLQLIEKENQSGRRGDDRRWGLYLLNRQKLDDSYLCEQGLSADSVPEAGQHVWLMRDISHTDGGSTHEVLEMVHPQTLKYSSIAAECIGIDLAGIDLIAQDIARPLGEQGGGFLEINAEPGIRLHLPPMCDRPRPIDVAILETLFAFGRPHRIPVVLVICNEWPVPSVSGWLDQQWPVDQFRAVSTTHETLVGDMRLNPKSMGLADRLRATLLHPRTAMVIAVASLEDVLNNGVGLDHLHSVFVAEPSDGLQKTQMSSPAKIRGLMRQLSEHSDHFYGQNHLG